LGLDPLTYASIIAGITSVYHHSQHLLYILSTGVDSNSDLPISSSQVAGIAGVSHGNQPFYFVFETKHYNWP
jgi:hypothetical protein